MQTSFLKEQRISPQWAWAGADEGSYDRSGALLLAVVQLRGMPIRLEKPSYSFRFVLQRAACVEAANPSASCHSVTSNGW